LFQRRVRVGHDTQIRAEDLADLHRINVNVYKFSALCVNAQGGASVPVGPPVADPEHKVAPQKGGVAVAVLSLDTDHSCIQPVIVGD
jgi:hypothetical protein